MATVTPLPSASPKTSARSSRPRGPCRRERGPVVRRERLTPGRGVRSPAADRDGPCRMTARPASRRPVRASPDRPRADRAMRSASRQRTPSLASSRASAAVVTRASMSAGSRASPPTPVRTVRSRRSAVALQVAGPDGRRGRSGQGDGHVQVAQVEAALAPPVEHLQHAHRPVVVGQGHGQQAARDVAGALGGRGPVEAGIGWPRRRWPAAGPWSRRSPRCRPRRRWSGRSRPGPAVRRRRRRSGGRATGSWTAIEAAWASRMVTAASATAVRTGRPATGSRRGAAASRRPTAASAATAAVDGPGRPGIPAAVRRRAVRLARRAHRRAAAASRAASGMTSTSPSKRSRPLGHEVGEQAVHRLARAADHARQLGLGVGPGQAMLARRRSSSGPASGAMTRSRWRARRPGRSRKWRSSTWAVRRRISPARVASSARRSSGSVSSSRSKASRRSTLRLDRVEGHGGRRARGAVEQGQLAEEAARADRRQDGRLGAVVRGDGDLDRAAGHEVQGVARVTGMEDGLATPEAPWSEAPRRPSAGPPPRPAKSAAGAQGGMGSGDRWPDPSAASGQGWTWPHRTRGGRPPSARRAGRAEVRCAAPGASDRRR